MFSSTWSLGSEILFFAGTGITILLAVGTLILAIVIGALAAAAASYIKKSSKYTDHSVSQAYEDCVIAAVTGLFVGGLVILSTVIYFSYKSYAKRSEEKKQPKETGKTE